MSLRSPSKISMERMARQAPTLTLIVPPDLPCGVMLQQTKMVYDQLLADKHGKLYQALLDQKTEYDVKCTELSAKNRDEALEYGVRAQEALNTLCTEYLEELTDQRRDYQDKLNKMYSQMDSTMDEKKDGGGQTAV